MKHPTILVCCSMIAILLLVGISLVANNANMTGYFASDNSIDAIRFNPMYIFGALTLVSLICLGARIYFKRYDTQN